MKPLATEEITFDNRKILLKFFDTPLKQGIRISQVSAFCIYKNQFVLVRNKRGWSIPGGHPKKNETIEESLERELSEEACLEKNDYTTKLIGWMKVEDPDNQGIEGKEYAQLRFLAIVNKLPEFVPDDEIFERVVVSFDEFSKYVSWGTSPTGSAQIRTLKSHIAS